MQSRLRLCCKLTEWVIDAKEGTSDTLKWQVEMEMEMKMENRREKQIALTKTRYDATAKYSLPNLTKGLAIDKITPLPSVSMTTGEMVSEPANRTLDHCTTLRRSLPRVKGCSITHFERVLYAAWFSPEDSPQTQLALQRCNY